MKKVVFLALVLLAILSGGGYLTFRQNAAVIRREATVKLDRYLQNTAEEYRRSIVSWSEIVRLWASHQDPAEILDGDPMNGIGEYLETTQEHVYNLKELSCIDRHGKVVSSTNFDLIGTTLGEVEELRHVFESEKFIADVGVERNRLRITVPILWGYDSVKIAGALRCEIVPEIWQKNLHEYWAGLSDADGAILYQNGDLRIARVDPSNANVLQFGNDTLVRSTWLDLPANIRAPRYRAAIAMKREDLLGHLTLIGQIVFVMTAALIGVIVVVVGGTGWRQVQLMRKLELRSADLAQANDALEHTHASLREQTERAQMGVRSRSQFLANMSHEIRTPMTAILGYLDILSGNLRDPENLETIHTVRTNAEYLLQLLNDILDFSKIDAGKLTVEKIRFSPISLVEEIRSLMAVRAEKRHIFLCVEYQGGVPETMASDPTRLKQGVLNLSGNAIKFTENGGVTIRGAASERNS